MDSALPAIFLCIGVALGAAAAWFFLRAHSRHEYDRGKADAQGEQIALTERLQARDQTIAAQNARIQQLEQKLQEGQTSESNLKAKLAQFATLVDQERKQSEEKLAVVNQAQQKLADAFKALSKNGGKGFGQMARMLGGGNLDMGKIAQMTGQPAPTPEQLEQMQAQLKNMPGGLPKLPGLGGGGLPPGFNPFKK